MPKEQLRDDEELVLALSEHWVSALIPMLLYGVGLGLGLALIWIAFSLRAEVPFVADLVLILAVLTVLAAQVWAYILFVARDLSEVYITNQRIIICDVLPYMRHDVGFFDLNAIREIERHKRGLWPNLLNYGHVEINLSGRTRPIQLKYVSNPGKVINQLNHLQAS